MWLWRKIGCAAVSLLLMTGIMFVSSRAAQAGPVPSCYGSVACGGVAPGPAGCLTGGVLVQDQSVPDLGDIDLFENPLCGSGTGWAVLENTTDAFSYSALSGNAVAEIFYVPPQGGVEQFSAIAWDGFRGDNATTTMVPLNGSLKACAGSPDNSGDPFDEDPQAQDGVVQMQQANNTIYDFTTGACTSWH